MMMMMAFLGLLFLLDLKNRMILQRGNLNGIVFRLFSLKHSYFR